MHNLIREDLNLGSPVVLEGQTPNNPRIGQVAVIKSHHLHAIDLNADVALAVGFPAVGQIV